MKHRTKESDNWGTPPEFYKTLNEEFNFDFDPCPMNYIADGLSLSWGKRNFINPPYSRTLKEAFINKAYEESLKGKLCVLLLPVSTSTRIFHNLILPKAKEIRFIKGRIKFLYNGKDNPKYNTGQFDNMLVIFK
jgi:hypothetical protein